uniref:Uncharacterized protein n=1 Tax=Strombidinopsis acuminata TaxID=141414 RepID=A0A7S3X676_9SPIT|mmetsp:Transcript_81237/g.112505  ORF Transcript_81237/g.112505 Transcript_81237/m.112505 type:complete len:112 (+) Transcript_81237:3-338(+)
MLFVFHLAEHDIRRTKEEWNSRRECRSFFVYVFFLLAVIGDIFDILAHGFVVLAGLTHVDHHFLHEVEYFGMGSAVVACFSVMVGEILAARARRRVARKSTVHIVPVTGGA